MSLNNTKLNAIRPALKNQKVWDGNGLYLFVPKHELIDGLSKKRMSWRFDYRFANKRYTLTIGPFPPVSLAEAREHLGKARKLLSASKNPAQQKREDKLLLQEANADSFAAVSQKWYESKSENRSEAWRASNWLYLDRDLVPSIGSLPISSVTSKILIAVLEKAKKSRGVKTAERIRQTAVQVFDYAIRKSKAATNQARDLRDWEDIPAAVSHKPLIGAEIPDFIDRVDAYAGQTTTKLSIKLLLLTFVRKTELIGAQWGEIDFERSLWLIPASRMKMKEPHVVPLASQTLGTLNELKIAGLGSKFLFPGLSSDEIHMSPSTLNVAFAKMGYGGRFSPHGIRATASTWLNEKNFRADVIERQLAHVERNRIRAAYNHADYLDERTKMMQAWADFLFPEFPTSTIE